MELHRELPVRLDKGARDGASAPRAAGKPRGKALRPKRRRNGRSLRRAARRRPIARLLDLLFAGALGYTQNLEVVFRLESLFYELPLLRRPQVGGSCGAAAVPVAAGRVRVRRLWHGREGGQTRWGLSRSGTGRHEGTEEHAAVSPPPRWGSSARRLCSCSAEHRRWSGCRAHQSASIAVGGSPSFAAVSRTAARLGPPIKAEQTQEAARTPTSRSASRSRAVTRQQQNTQICCIRRRARSGQAQCALQWTAGRIKHRRRRPASPALCSPLPLPADAGRGSATYPCSPSPTALAALQRCCLCYSETPGSTAAAPQPAIKRCT